MSGARSTGEVAFLIEPTLLSRAAVLELPRYPAIEYTPPHGRYSLDILSRLGEAFCFEDLESEVLVIDGISIHVATPGQLYRMKKSTVRPQDRIDAQAIRERFNLEEGDE